MVYFLAVFWQIFKFFVPKNIWINLKQLLFYACFHFEQILLNKILLWKSWFFQVLLHKQKTKVYFSQKARLLGFHWVLSRMPHGYAYQKIPFPFQKQFMEVIPLQGRTVLRTKYLWKLAKENSDLKDQLDFILVEQEKCKKADLKYITHSLPYSFETKM